MQKTSKPKPTVGEGWRLIQRLSIYARHHMGRLLLGVLLMLIAAAASVGPAKLIEPIINDIFIGKNASMLLPATFGVFAVFLTKGLATYGETVIMSAVGQRMIANIQRDLFDHIVHADLAFYHRTPSGDLVSRFTNDVTKLHNAVTGTLTNICKDSLTLIAFVALMFYQDALLATCAFVILPVAILPVARIGRRLRKAAKTIQSDTAGLSSILTQAFQGVRLIKSYALEGVQSRAVADVVERLFERSVKAVRTKAAGHPLMEFLGGVAIAIVILYGGQQVIAGEQSPGAFFSFIAALLLAYEPLKRLTNLNANLQEQLGAASRVFALLDLQPKITEASQPRALQVSKGEIILDHVCFSYEGGGEVLADLSLQIPGHAMVAFVGASGAGKSTLINLIPRFYDVGSGAIRIDGQDIREVSLASLRKNIALVSQEVILFDETIRTNIAMGLPGEEVSDDAIMAAAKAAAAHDFIMDFPEGYDTRVGEHGVRLSGGQRQRLSIARAMLKNAPILLLDEPTSALDSESEHKVQQALRALERGRTTLIIAHRLATVKEADLIVVMDKGRIVALGRHEELLVSSPRYAELCRGQLAAPAPQSGEDGAV
ncbi:MAG: ABC transporter ATP-binding protein [Holosporales bacterium]